MTTHYQTLGVEPTASIDEIKKAFRSLAAKHHPDKGGNKEKFQEISLAYDILSSERKRAEYDAQLNGSRFSHRFDVDDLDPAFRRVFEDFFANHSQWQPQKNRDVSIVYRINLKDAYLGKEIEISRPNRTGETETIKVTIPSGVFTGAIIRVHEKGDDASPNLPRGDLNITIDVADYENYFRVNNDLCKPLEINAIDAMIGSTERIKLISGEEIDLKINPGTQPGTKYAIPRKGFKSLQTGEIGNLIFIVSICVPKITDTQKISKIKELFNSK